MPFDYSQAPDPRDFGELIPHGTIATVQMRIRPGNVGEDGFLKRSKAGDSEYLDSEFVVLDGPHAKRKVFDTFLLARTTDPQQEMVRTNCGRLKKILESAHGIKSGDASERARKAYSATLKDFDNLIFIAKIGVRKGGPKNADRARAGLTRTCWRARSGPSRRNGIRSSNRRPLTVVGLDQPLLRLPRPRVRHRAPDRFLHRAGRSNEKGPHHRRGLAVRARGRMAAAGDRRHRGRARRRQA